MGDDGTLNDHSPHDPSDLLSTEMDPMDGELLNLKISFVNYKTIFFSQTAAVNQ